MKDLSDVSIIPARKNLPVFIKCKDGKYYEDLVYQDIAIWRDWFLVFSPTEPAEFVMRESAWEGGFKPERFLSARGFGPDCVSRIVNGRKDKHLRFFGCDEKGVPTMGHQAISWFLILKKGAPLPTPMRDDSCVEIYPYYPNIEGIYFGDSK